MSTLLPSTTWPATLRPDLRLSTGHTSPKDPQPGYNESVSGVVDKFCDERVHMDVLWLKTRFGRRAMAACPRDLIGEYLHSISIYISLLCLIKSVVELLSKFPQVILAEKESIVQSCHGNIQE